VFKYKFLFKSLSFFVQTDNFDLSDEKQAKVLRFLYLPKNFPILFWIYTEVCSWIREQTLSKELGK